MSLLNKSFASNMNINNYAPSERFNFTRGLRIFVFVLILIGIVSLSYAVLNGYPLKRILVAIFVNNFYFLSISFAGTFFIAVQYLAGTSWYVCFKRVPEAISSYFPVAGLVILALCIDPGRIYPWVHSAELSVKFPNKFLYLEPGFFTFRTVIYILPWAILSSLIKKISLRLDTSGDVKLLKHGVLYSSAFVVFSAITTSTSSWDWLMSIEPHWYSALFGWYNFAGMFLSGVASMTILVSFLKVRGYLSLLNENHLNDLGKYVFSLSIFWAYLWYSQFFIIWYGNIPEEVSYFFKRAHDYEVIFYGNIIANFGIPFFLLLSKKSRQRVVYLIVASLAILVGRWFDLYLMVAPGISEAKSIPDIFEIGMFVGFLGVFMLVVFRFLSSNNLIPSGHPYFKESLNHT